MKRKRKKIVPAGTIKGHKIGTKRKDMRFMADDGSIWDSKFEWQVWEGAKDAKVQLVRADKEGKGDTISYFHQVRGASCQDCGSPRVGRIRGITPDLLMPGWHPVGGENGGYLEIKGYMRADKRALYRSLLKETPGLSLCIIIQSDYRVGKGTFSQWITKHLKVPVFHWRGVFPKPNEWILPVEPKLSKRAKRSDKA